MLAAIEGIGRRLLVDFGFGSFLEKFEEHFGKWPIRFLLLLIGLTATLACGKLIWEIALGPLIDAITKAGLVVTALKAFWMGVAFAAGCAAASGFYVAYSKWRIGRSLVDIEQRQNELISKSERIGRQNDLFYEETEQKLAEMRTKLEALTDQSRGQA